MSIDDVLYSKEDGIGIVSLNRPEKLNAITYEVSRRLRSLIEEINKDAEIRVVILTGCGRAFCAGTDITNSVLDIEGNVQRMKDRYSTEFRQSMWFFNSIPKPVICAINGPAVGLGSELTLHCDFRIASESAKWGQVFVMRGMVPDTGAGTYLLPYIVGLPKACELVFTGKIIDAQEMLKIGLVSKVVPDAELMSVAKEMASELKRGAPLAVQMCKQLMYMGLERTIEAHQDATRFCFLMSTQTQDFKEGIQSFLEKREPNWKGK